MATTTIPSTPAAAPRLAFDAKGLIIGVCLAVTVYPGEFVDPEKCVALKAQGERAYE